MCVWTEGNERAEQGNLLMKSPLGVFVMAEQQTCDLRLLY